MSRNQLRRPFEEDSPASSVNKSLPSITGGTQDQIARAEEIRAKCALVIQEATQYHYDTIANSFPDATPQAKAAMREAARDGVAEVSRKWLGQTAATWWIEQERVSIAEVIEDAVKSKVLAAARVGSTGHSR